MFSMYRSLLLCVGDCYLVRASGKVRDALVDCDASNVVAWRIIIITCLSNTVFFLPTIEARETTVRVRHDE